jgi:hypothetical protein
MASAGLIALLQHSTSKVHFVFGNILLMKRDVKDFLKYWPFFNLSDRVQYHCSLTTVECGYDELIVVDEADEYIYS